jgi:trk system potassium uptake protein TrkH
MMYLATYALGVLAITALGYSLREAAFEFASSLGTVGLSIGITGAHSPPALLYIEMVGMILGRLEFTVIFIGVAKMGQAIPRLLRPNGRA